MIDLLSLPRQAVVDYGHMKSQKLGSGLPLNSLPGWESIPLNSKLPMLKCPGNQVIFTKDKIGQSLLSRLEHDFDTSFQDKITEYNPLHDLNLRSFYANENNLKRLRANNEITEFNDVICTLKDFNEHRQQIHKSYIYYFMQSRRQEDYKMRDRKFMNNAENITNVGYESQNLRTQSFHEIWRKRNSIDAEKARRKLLAVLRTEEQMQKIAEKKQLFLERMAQKKLLHEIIIKQHQDARDEHMRKKLIQVKKMYQLKKFRFEKTLRALLEKRNVKYNMKDVEKWERRLANRVQHQKYIQKLKDEKERRRQEHIKNHMETMRDQWARIQIEIKQRKLMNKMPKKHKKHKVARRPSVDYIYGNTIVAYEERELYSDSDVPLQTKKGAPCRKDDSIDYSLDQAAKEPINLCELQRLFENMMDYELCDALRKIIDIEADPNLPFDDQDPSYKLANFIITNVILTYNKDLTVDEAVFKMVTNRMLRYFDEIKIQVLQRARQIISSIQSGVGLGEGAADFNAGRYSSVSFKRYSATIGVSSYEINPNVDLRKASKRKPTPAGSLASILAAEPQLPPAQPVAMPKLSRNDAVFIEHFTVKFKRELTVRMGKLVFAAIQQYFAGNPKQVRKDLLDLDKTYMAKVAAEGVLKFNICNLNFYSALRLCGSVLSTEAIWLLYRQVLRKDRDTRGIKKHKRFKNDWVCLMYEEKIKEDLRCVPANPAEGLFGQRLD